MKNMQKAIIFILPIIIMSSILVLFYINGITRIDNYIVYNVTKNMSYSTIEAMKIITNSCSAIIFLLTILLVILTGKNKKIGIFFLLDLVICYLLNTIIKNIVARQRPLDYMLIDESGYSFPSAHSMLAVAFYGYLAFIIIKYIKNSSIKVTCLILTVFLTILIGISRVCLGVHFPSDVVGGFLIGYLYIILYLHIVKKYI